MRTGDPPKGGSFGVGMLAAMTRTRHGCAIAECEKPHNSRGYCSAHASRLRRYGDPLAGPRGQYGRPLAERFWEKVDKQGADEHWLWTNFVRPDGYATMLVDGQSLLVHRIAWLLEHGALPPAALELDHLCHTRHCVNLKHIELVTHAVNTARANRRRATMRSPLRLRVRPR